MLLELGVGWYPPPVRFPRLLDVQSQLALPKAAGIMGPMSMTLTCAVIRCTDESLPGSRLCGIYQARLDRGGGLPRSDDPVLGDPSGFGRFGELHVNASGILCHECGGRLVSLAQHIRRAHHMSADEYRSRHGLFDETKFMLPPAADGAPRRRPHPCRHCGGDVFTQTAKLCPGCSATYWEERELRRQNKPQRRPRWRDLTGEEVTRLQAASHQEQPFLVRQLQADRVPSNAIGKVLGLSQARMSHIFPRAGWGSGKK